MATEAISAGFSSINPGRFGDFEAMPNINSEMKLRLKTLQIKGEQDVENAISIMSKCFDEQEKVREFMEKNMFAADFLRLRAFLAEGPQGLKQYDDAIKSAIDKEVDAAIAEARKEAKDE